MDDSDHDVYITGSMGGFGAMVNSNPERQCGCKKAVQADM